MKCKLSHTKIVCGRAGRRKEPEFRATETGTARLSLCGRKHPATIRAIRLRRCAGWLRSSQWGEGLGNLSESFRRAAWEVQGLGCSWVCRRSEPAVRCRAGGTREGKLVEHLPVIWCCGDRSGRDLGQENTYALAIRAVCSVEVGLYAPRKVSEKH